MTPATNQAPESAAEIMSNLSVGSGLPKTDDARSSKKPASKKAKQKSPKAAPRTRKATKPAPKAKKSATPRAKKPAKAPKAAAPRETKSSVVIAMLQRPDGATSAEIEKRMGWLNKTVRGFIAGTVKGKLGFKVESDRINGGERTYRIV